MPRAVAAMADQQRDLGLMHRIDHGRRGAGAAEPVTDVDDVGDAGAFAAEIVRHHDAQEALAARGGDRLARKARLAIDRRRVLRSDGGDRAGPTFEIGADKLGRCCGRDFARSERQIACRSDFFNRRASNVHR